MPSALSYGQENSCRVDYNIEARLDTLERAVIGAEVVTWHNNNLTPTSEFYFHLYLNAFSNSNTTFIRESGLNLSEESRGWIRIVSVTDLRARKEISRNLRFVQPDDGNAFDSTVAIISLDRTVKPGDSVSFQIRFYAKLPRSISGTGWAPGTHFYMIARWFPQIGVFQNGTWNCHQVHCFTDISSDFGNYTVSMTVPSGFAVGASGQSAGEKINGDGTATYIFSANNINDFAWAASRTFIVKNHTFSYSGLPRLSIRLLLQPNHYMLMNRYLCALDTAIKYFGIWYGPYPYQAITVVDIPRTASLGEAEYPALVFVSAGDYPIQNYLSPENVIIHQYGHQYWHGMAVSNRYECFRLDEGISSFCADKLLEMVYGPAVSIYRIANVYPVRLFPIYEFAGIPIAALIGDVWIGQKYKGLRFYLDRSDHDAISKCGFGVFNRTCCPMAAYNKAELILNTLEGLIGDSVMTEVLRNYFDEFLFGHPGQADFEKVCERVSGKRLSWFFDELVEGRGTVDYAVRSLDYFREIDLSTNVTSYEVSVVVVKNGSVTLPVDVRLGFEDGSAIDTMWDGENGWKVFKFVVHSIPEFAQVDPFNKIPIDICYSNNSYVINSDMKGIIYWVNQIITYAQNLLYAFIVFI
ncbi:MAG: M1 family metallopeptidase [Candidatus Kryptoniota bacterium]